MTVLHTELVDMSIRCWPHLLLPYFALKDTKDTVMRLQQINVTSNMLIQSLDINLLYTNIRDDLGITAMQHFLDMRLNLFITALLHFLLTYNYFIFNGKCYHQIT